MRIKIGDYVLAGDSANITTGKIGPGIDRETGEPRETVRAQRHFKFLGDAAHDMATRLALDGADHEGDIQTLKEVSDNMLSLKSRLAEMVHEAAAALELGVSAADRAAISAEGKKRARAAARAAKEGQ